MPSYIRYLPRTRNYEREPPLDLHGLHIPEICLPGDRTTEYHLIQTLAWNRGHKYEPAFLIYYECSLVLHKRYDSPQDRAKYRSYDPESREYLLDIQNHIPSPSRLGLY